MNPNKKYILLAVSGETPQIITETFFKLKSTGYDIHEIHVITTVRGKSNLIQLLSDDPEKNIFLKMCSEYGWEPLTVEDRNIHVFFDQDGGFLDDIRTDCDERCAADFIFKTTKELMDRRYGEDESEYYPIVASIAGGRKTMSYLMGSTMSILGREDDELTHVLVDPKFERLDRSSPKFYYPTVKSMPLVNADQENIDAMDAKVDLSFIPFIKLGHLLKDSKKGSKLFSGNSTTAYSDAVDAINYELGVKSEDLMLTVDYRNLKLIVNNTRTDKPFVIKLEALQMAFYRMLLDNLRKPASVVKPSKESSIPSLFRYWLKLYSYTPVDREWSGTDSFVSEINKIIADVCSRKCLADSEREKKSPKTGFWYVYDVVTEKWKDYADRREGLSYNGMGQACPDWDDEYDQKTPKKRNQLDYICNEDSFKNAHIDNWKKIQDSVNNAIKSSCPDAVADILCIKCRGINNTREQNYSIGLKWSQVAMPGYESLPFEKLTVSDEEISLRQL